MHPATVTRTNADRTVVRVLGGARSCRADDRQRWAHTSLIGIARCRMLDAARWPEYRAAETVAGSSVQVASPAIWRTPPTGVARSSWSAVVEPTVMYA